MISFLRNLWDSFGSEKQYEIRRERFKNVQRFLDDQIEREQGDDVTTQLSKNIMKTGNDDGAYTTATNNTTCSNRVGVVTALTNNNGVIDYDIFFELSVCVRFLDVLKVGCRVEYLAYQPPNSDYIKVVKILQVLEQCWDDVADGTIEEKIEEQMAVLRTEKPKYFETNERTILGMITDRRPDSIRIDTDYKQLNVQLDAVEIDFVPKEGDRVCVCCSVQMDDHYTDKQGEILEELSVHPAGMLKQKKCTVRCVYDDWAAIDDDCYVTFDILPNTCNLSVGDVVTADMIECERGDYIWRCIALTMLKKASTLPPAALQQSDHENSSDSHPIGISGNLACVFSDIGQKQTVEVTITNKCQRTMNVSGVTVVGREQRDSVLRLVEPTANATAFQLQPAEERIVRFEVQSRFFGESHADFIINLIKFKVRRSIHLMVCEDELAAATVRANLKERTMITPPIDTIGGRNMRQRSRYYANQVWSKKNEVIPGVRMLTQRRFVAVRIEQYDVPERLRSIYLLSERRHEMLENIEAMFPCLCKELSPENYTSRFRALLHLEEIEQFVNFRKFDRERAHFNRDGEYLSLTIENLSERRPSLVIGDTVRAINPWSSEAGSHHKEQPSFDGVIHKVLYDRVLLKFNTIFQAKYNGEDYRLEFYFSRFAMRKQHHSINRIVQNLGECYLFPTRIRLREHVQLPVRLDAAGNMHLYDTAIPWYNAKLTIIQKRAVHSILRGEALMPYVVFGPPGTGKTYTLIEAILQLVYHLPGARLLVATPSNGAADLIATRLIDSGVLRPGDFVRLVSQNSVERNLVPEHLLPYCATPDFGADGCCEDAMVITDSGLKLRCQKKYLGRHRISIGTCTTLGNFIPMGFSGRHFTHAIIDESGQCTEPEVMVPIAQLARESGQIVLAGDPYQLSPIVMNKLAGERGLELSFLERLLARNPYQKDILRYPETSGYDGRLVTKLLHNYRALPAILRVYNELFYDTELLPMVDEEESREARCLGELNTLLPLSKKRPKMHGAFFYGMRSENKQDSDSPSWYNPLEAKNVFLMTIQLYSKDIHPDDIGIITPYSRQVKHLRTLFTVADIAMPKIGTVEEFQGQERDIILISTVRSTQLLLPSDMRHALGFVCSAKRMNVAVSRARYLLFVFGNPHLLALDACWRSYIKYAVDNDAYLGCDLPQHLVTSDGSAEETAKAH